MEEQIEKLHSRIDHIEEKVNATHAKVHNGLSERSVKTEKAVEDLTRNQVKMQSDIAYIKQEQADINNYTKQQMSNMNRTLQAMHRRQDEEAELRLRLNIKTEYNEELHNKTLQQLNESIGELKTTHKKWNKIGAGILLSFSSTVLGICYWIVVNADKIQKQFGIFFN